MSEQTPPLPDPTPQEQYQYLFKIILIGDTSTGKTSLIHRYIDRQFDDKYICTIGVDFFTKEVISDDNKMKLLIWDTAGMEKYRSISSSYYRGSHAAMIIFDITNKSSFENIDKWLESYNKNRSSQFERYIALIGNKSDWEERREVSQEEAKEFAKMNKMWYWETSAKEDINVDKVFHEIGRNLLDIYKDARPGESKNEKEKHSEKIQVNNTNFKSWLEKENGKCC